MSKIDTVGYTLCILVVVPFLLIFVFRDIFRAVAGAEDRMHFGQRANSLKKLFADGVVTWARISAIDEGGILTARVVGRWNGKRFEGHIRNGMREWKWDGESCPQAKSALGADVATAGNAIATLLGVANEEGSPKLVTETCGDDEFHCLVKVPDSELVPA